MSDLGLRNASGKMLFILNELSPSGCDERVTVYSQLIQVSLKYGYYVDILLSDVGHGLENLPLTGVSFLRCLAEGAASSYEAVIYDEFSPDQQGVLVSLGTEGIAIFKIVPFVSSFALTKIPPEVHVLTWGAESEYWLAEGDGEGSQWVVDAGFLPKPVEQDEPDYVNLPVIGCYLDDSNSDQLSRFVEEVWPDILAMFGEVRLRLFVLSESEVSFDHSNFVGIEIHKLEKVEHIVYHMRYLGVWCNWGESGAEESSELSRTL